MAESRAHPSGYSIRPRKSADDEQLVRVENAASELFRTHGYPEVADHGLDVAALRRLIDGRHVWVAAAFDDRPVGFAVASPIADHLHLAELSVDPVHGRQGLGRALVETVTEAATQQGLAGVSLTTFRDLSFNQPYYEKLGFRELAVDQADPRLAARLSAELPAGVDISSRVLMVRLT